MGSSDIMQTISLRWTNIPSRLDGMAPGVWITSGFLLSLPLQETCRIFVELRTLKIIELKTVLPCRPRLDEKVSYTTRTGSRNHQIVQGVARRGGKTKGIGGISPA